MHILRPILLLALLSTTLACSKPLGAECEADGDCGGGLSCLQTAVSVGGDQCTEGSKLCTRACDADSDCDADNDEVCVDTCDDARDVCVVRSTSDLPFSANCVNDGECAEGLSCLPLSIGTPGDCAEPRLVCTVTCENDEDACTELGGFCNGQCDDAIAAACIAGG